jgi:hypothetical protein
MQKSSNITIEKLSKHKGDLIEVTSKVYLFSIVEGKKQGEFIDSRIFLLLDAVPFSNFKNLREVISAKTVDLVRTNYLAVKVFYRGAIFWMEVDASKIQLLKVDETSKQELF